MRSCLACLVLYSTRKRFLGLVLKIGTETQGGWGCVRVEQLCCGVCGTGLLTLVPPVPSGQAGPRGIGLGLAQGFLFAWPGWASVALKPCEM